jgi:preprotein translocase subunit SecF
VGIVVGTYSSVYIASPFALLWEQMFGSDRRARRSVAKATQAKTSSRGAA